MNFTINEIVKAINSKKVRISDHAYEEAQSDNLTFEEIYYSVMHDEIIEEYPDDKPYPSCLILGYTFGNEPIHSVWAFNNENQWAVLIAVYRPDPELWFNFRERKKI